MAVDAYGSSYPLKHYPVRDNLTTSTKSTQYSDPVTSSATAGTWTDLLLGTVNPEWSKQEYPNVTQKALLYLDTYFIIRCNGLTAAEDIYLKVEMRDKDGTWVKLTVDAEHRHAAIGTSWTNFQIGGLCDLSNANFMHIPFDWKISFKCQTASGMEAKVRGDSYMELQWKNRSATGDDYSVPSTSPSASPSASASSTVSESPSASPSASASASPSASPTTSPSASPSSSVSASPSTSVLASPTTSPSSSVSASPTTSPSSSVSASPSTSVSSSPTTSPSASLSASPTASASPSSSVSASPSVSPSASPSSS